MHYDSPATALNMMAALMLLTITPLCSDPVRVVYGHTRADLYLTGQFDPRTHPSFATASSFGIPDKGRGLYLRREALEALRKLHAHLQKDLRGIPFWVQSGTRNYENQQSIWEAKWNGHTRVGGIKLSTVKDPLERARRILGYSSMPGTSRHHWGTDFDINILTVDYYRSGEGKRLFNWLLKHAPDYGFCLVYTEGRTKGYNFEPWHWSYRPLSSVFVDDWERLYRSGTIRKEDLKFSGSQHAFALAPEYVGEINSACR